MRFNEFSVIFGVLSEYFGSEPSAGVSEVYFKAFEDWRKEDFERACAEVMANRVFNGLPKIAEIREAIHGKIEDAVALAWESFMSTLKIGPWETVVFEDGAIGHAIEAMGGWERVNKWTVEECRMRRKEFESIYLANLRRGNTAPMKMVGLFESSNTENGFLDHIPKPIQIQSKNKALIEMQKAKLLS